MSMICEHDIYMSIIENIEKNIKEKFLREVGDENILEDFIAQWKEKFLKTKVVETGRCTTFGVSKSSVKIHHVDNFQINKKPQSSIRDLVNVRINCVKSEAKSYQLVKEEEHKNIGKGIVALLSKPIKPLPNLKIIVNPTTNGINPIHEINEQPRSILNNQSMQNPHELLYNPPHANHSINVMSNPTFNTPPGFRFSNKNKSHDQRLLAPKLIPPPLVRTTNNLAIASVNRPEPILNTIVNSQALRSEQKQQLCHKTPQQRQRQITVPQQRQLQRTLPHQMQQRIMQQQRQIILPQQHITIPQEQLFQISHQQLQQHIFRQQQLQIPQLQQVSSQMIRMVNPNNPPSEVPRKYVAIAPAPPRPMQHFALRSGRLTPYPTPNQTGGTPQQDQQNYKLWQYDGPSFMDDSDSDSDEWDAKHNDELEFHSESADPLNVAESKEIDQEEVVDIDSIVMPTKKEIEEMFECEDLIICIFNDLKIKKGKIKAKFESGVIRTLGKEKIFGFSKVTFD